MRNLSSWSIRNPVPTIVLFIALMIAGIAGYTTLRINNVPDLESPAIVVTVAQPGAAPSEMETQVTRLVEDSVAGLGRVKHIRSTINDGISVTTVEFFLGTDTDRATNDVRNAVANIRPDLPAGLDEFFDRALAKHPADRLESGAAFARALRDFNVASGA